MRSQDKEWGGKEEVVRGKREQKHSPTPLHTHRQAGARKPGDSSSTSLLPSPLAPSPASSTWMTAPIFRRMLTKLRSSLLPLSPLITPLPLLLVLPSDGVVVVVVVLLLLLLLQC